MEVIGSSGAAVEDRWVMVWIAKDSNGKDSRKWSGRDRRGG